MKAMHHYLPIQYCFALNTTRYQQQVINYGPLSVLYYQFVTHTDQSELSIVPDGCVDIQFCCEKDKWFAYVCGTTLKGKTVYFEPGRMYFGVRFSPLDSRRIRWLPYRILAENQVSLDTMRLPSNILQDTLCDAQPFVSRIKHVEVWLKKLGIIAITTTDSIDYCIDQIYKNAGHLKISQLADSIGISDRRLRQRFTDAIGVPPKLFCRIQRFQRALQYLNERKNDRLIGTDILFLNYHDESHVAKEFLEFAQQSASSIHRLLARSAEL